MEDQANSSRAASADNAANRHWVSREELQALRDKLREAQETLEAIQSGEVDAVVVTGKEGSQIYTLSGADEPYRVFVEQMQEGAVTVSASGVILYCNRKFAEFLEIDLERVISSAASEHFGNEVWQAVVKGLDSSKVKKTETRIKRASGDALPIMITASRLAMVDQNVFCLVVTDLSEQKEKSELAIAKEIAEAANHSKDSFLAVLSHELRTPLTPALMAASLLERDKNLSEKSRELATMIRRNVELETRLIDDLLDLTRITQGKIKLITEPVDIHAILKEAATICSTEIDELRQRLDVSFEATQSHVMGDPVRLQQIFWNLIRNASKFSGRQKTIHVRCYNTNDSRIKVSVRDEGVGIEKEILDKLFSPFEQGGEDITRRFGGLGLGLVISKSIAELHDGGGVEAFSKGRDLGSTFTLTLNVLPTDPRQNSAQAEPSRGSILLIEDNADTRLAVSMLLEMMNYEVHQGGSVKCGVDLAKHQRFDMVVSDIGLPDGTGYDLMRELKSGYGLRGIAISGYGQPEDVDRALEAGFEMHLTKPVSASELEKAISSILTDSRA